MTRSRETWKEIPGFNGRYEVSDRGRVRKTGGRLLKIGRMVNGYMRVGLKTATKWKGFKVHHLVAKAFLGYKGWEYDYKIGFARTLVVDHLNCIKSDNRPSNLEICTWSENSKRGYPGRGRPLYVASLS